MGVPQPGGVPTQGTPLARSGRGYPSQGVPTQGTPLARSGWEIPQPRGCHLGYPPQGQDRGVPQPGGVHPGYPPPPPPRYRTAHGVLDKRRSVCLLRSRRRTLLCRCIFTPPSHPPRIQCRINTT